MNRDEQQEMQSYGKKEFHFHLVTRDDGGGVSTILGDDLRKNNLKVKRKNGEGREKGWSDGRMERGNNAAGEWYLAAREKGIVRTT